MACYASIHRSEFSQTSSSHWIAILWSRCSGKTFRAVWYSVSIKILRFRLWFTNIKNFSGNLHRLFIWRSARKIILNLTLGHVSRLRSSFLSQLVASTTFWLIIPSWLPLLYLLQFHYFQGNPGWNCIGWWFPCAMACYKARDKCDIAGFYTSIIRFRNLLEPIIYENRKWKKHDRIRLHNISKFPFFRVRSKK